MPSVFRRVFDNQWTASEDRLVDPDDLDAAMCLRGDLAPVAGERYVISLDLGLKNDATVAAVAHREPVDDGDRGSWRVVVDRLRRWRGSREQPLEIAPRRGGARRQLSERYDRAQVVVDPWQAMGLVQRLQARSVSAEEFPFTTQSVGRLAHGLYTLLRSQRLHLPDDEVLREELLAVRLRETQPGPVPPRPRRRAGTTTRPWRSRWRVTTCCGWVSGLCRGSAGSVDLHVPRSPRKEDRMTAPLSLAGRVSVSERRPVAPSCG